MAFLAMDSSAVLAPLQGEGPVEEFSEDTTGESFETLQPTAPEAGSPRHGPIAGSRRQRPQPNVRIRDTKAERWLHDRFSELTLEQLGSEQIVIYSTHEMEPPLSFRHVWFTIASHHRMYQLSRSEATLLSRSTACLILCDTSSGEHLQAAGDIATSICSLGIRAPGVTLVPHSVQPELQPLSGDPEAQAREDLVIAMDANVVGIDDVLLGQPAGLELACQVQSRIMHQSENSRKCNDQLNNLREECMRVWDLEDDIHDCVWEYLRTRLKSQLPDRDPTIGAGQPEQVDGFLVGARLGEGSFGTVCRLVDPEKRADQVLKMVVKKGMTHVYGMLSLRRQLEVMKLISSETFKHVNIVQFYAAYHSDTHVLFRMEDGGKLDLYKRLCLRERGDTDMQLDVEKCTAIIHQCMAALSHLHLLPGVVHHDIKPENIVVSERVGKLVVKLTDFDTAQVVQPGELCRGVVGTFPFMAAEVVGEHPYDPWAPDIWSMGMVFLEVICRLEVVKKSMGLAMPRKTATKKEQRKTEKMLLCKIRDNFAIPNKVGFMLDRNIRMDLQAMGDDAQTTLEGMMEVEVDKRWTAEDLVKAQDELF